jgi:uncharacterized membrane protein (UPF0182 family)
MDERIPDVIDWPPRRPARRLGWLVLIMLAVVLLGARTSISYYVESLWFESLGYGAVFWKTLNVQAVLFIVFATVTFGILYGAFLVLNPGDLTAGVLMINGRPVTVPIDRVIRPVALLISIAVALGTGAGMMADWPTLALWWYARADAAAPSAAASLADPIFGRTLGFYLFTLPAWQLIADWLTTLAVIVTVAASLFFAATGGAQMLRGRRGTLVRPGRGLSIAWGFLLFMLAVRVYLSRYDRLFEDHTVFSGVTYTDAHVTLTGLLIVAGALVAGAVVAFASAVRVPRIRWLVIAIVPAVACYIGVSLIGAYVSSFIVKPNELVRETPYIAHNIAMTREAYGLSRIEQRAFPAETGVEAAEADKNQATLQNIRLWDWRALQDTLRQVQEIRTYYDFPDIDLDRYTINGELRQVMLGTRELNLERLPEGSRNWINEKLIYTHGYGITMNLVNGFTPEGLPQFILRDMPVQSTVAGMSVTRPEVYFGELTNGDVYVKTRQKEFNYPQGQSNNLTSYEGTGGIAIGGLLRRLLIAIDRGDLAKLPFSDDVSAESRLLMRRNVRARAAALAPFLTYDLDPYVVVGDNGRLSWIIDAFTSSDGFPYSRHYRLEGSPVNYLRNSVKVVVDAYDGATTFYVFDPEDPIIAAYRRLFPTLFRDGSAMPADLRHHVRYPELLLALQAQVYALYHMTDPEVFYNREDLWTVATEVALNEQREQTALPMEPNFVLMTLPGERRIEFVEILPFTPSNRNNLIGWIAGRSDEPNYGKGIVYDFPKSRLVDGPLQVEARIDQNPQISGQLTLWNQQGSHVRRGNLLVIPIGRGLLYAEPIYLQAERSPMPELRLVVLALQEKLSFAPTFEAALAGLFGQTMASAAAAPVAGQPAAPATPAEARAAPAEIDALIAAASADLADYQRLTAEGRLGEAGQKLEHLKRTLEELARRRR